MKLTEMKVKQSDTEWKEGSPEHFSRALGPLIFYRTSYRPSLQVSHIMKYSLNLYHVNHRFTYCYVASIVWPPASSGMNTHQLV